VDTEGYRIGAESTGEDMEMKRKLSSGDKWFIAMITVIVLYWIAQVIRGCAT